MLARALVNGPGTRASTRPDEDRADGEPDHHDREAACAVVERVADQPSGRPRSSSPS